MSETKPPFEKAAAWSGTNRSLTQRVVEAREGERRRLSREVHDGILQSIIGSQMVLNRLLDDLPSDTSWRNELLEVRECMAQATSEGRCLLEELRSPMIEESGLIEATDFFLQRMQKETGIEFELEDRSEGNTFPTEIRNNLFRVIQEGVRNVIKHSGSRRALVTIGLLPEEAWIQVRDWGTGFEVESLDITDDHIGMASLRERAELLDGQLQLTSVPGQGTTLRLTVPLGMSVGQETLSHLRERAHSLLQMRPSDEGEELLASALDAKEVAALLHEFEIHRIELEIQNQELRTAQLSLLNIRMGYRDLFQACATGILELDANDRVTGTNAALREMLGHSSDDLLHKALPPLLRKALVDHERGEFQLARSQPPGWFWAELDKRALFGHTRFVTVNDLTLRIRNKELKRGVQTLLALAKGYEALAGMRRGGLPSQTEDLLPIDKWVESLLSMLSGRWKRAEMTFRPGAGETGIRVDPCLFSVVVDQLVKLSVGSSGPMVLSTGTLTNGGESFCYLEVADRTRGELDTVHQRAVLKLERLVSTVGGRMSMLSDQSRGNTVRLIFPAKDPPGGAKSEIWCEKRR